MSILLRVCALLSLLAVLMNLATLPALIHFPATKPSAAARGHWLASIDSSFFSTVLYAAVLCGSLRLLIVRQLWLRSRVLEVICAIIVLYELSYAVLVATEWHFVHRSDGLLSAATTIYTPIDRLASFLVSPASDIYHLTAP